MSRHERRTPRPGSRRLGRAAALVVAFPVALVVALPACGDDSKPANRSTASTTSTTSATTTSSASTTVPSAPTSSNAPLTTDPTTDVGDYEGQRFDFGEITQVRREAGRAVVIFNRQQLYMDDGSPKSGTQFTEEPVIYGNTDVPYLDTSKATRRFVLADDVKILRIEDPVPCASDEIPTDPTWSSISVDDLLSGAWRDRLFDSLTFDSAGRVSQVRLSSGC